jgi:hypothetical protein
MLFGVVPIPNLGVPHGDALKEQLLLKGISNIETLSGK